MTRVLYWWMEPNAGGSRSKYWCWMPECPAVGTTIAVPAGGPLDERGNTDPENTIHMEVHRITWTCDGTPFWHAEVELR